MQNFFNPENDTQIIRQSLKNKGKSLEKLAPGFYSVDNIGGMFQTIIAFEPVKERDKIIPLEGGILSEVFNKIRIFSKEETKIKYKEMNVSHKLGMIFHGPQGTGKTCLASLLIKELVEKKDAICLDFTGITVQFINSVVEDLRTVQNNMLVLFVDEIDGSIKNQEEQWLTLLDGTDSIDNCIIIGCTNNLDKIPDRIKKRPSRIKYLFEIKAFPIEVYKQFIIEKIPTIGKEMLNKIAFLSEEQGLTLDELKHLLIDYYIEGIQIETNIQTIKKTI